MAIHQRPRPSTPTPGRLSVFGCVVTLRLTLETVLFTVAIDPDRLGGCVERSAAPSDTEAVLDADVAVIDRELSAHIGARSRWGVVFDVRRAPSRSDPRLEAMLRPRGERLFAAFARWAVVVRTAAGRLQLRRVVESHGGSRTVFDDLDEALTWAAGAA